MELKAGDRAERQAARCVLGPHSPRLSFVLTTAYKAFITAYLSVHLLRPPLL
jgi:hypothetical protein